MRMLIGRPVTYDYHVLPVFICLHIQIEVDSRRVASELVQIQ